MGNKHKPMSHNSILGHTLMLTSGFLRGSTDQGSGFITETIDLAVFENSKDAKCQSSLPNWDFQISGATGALLPNDQPIVCGGYQPAIYQDDCKTIRFNGVRFEWYNKVKMSHHRTWASSVVLRNGLWITGGISQDEGTSTSTEIVSRLYQCTNPLVILFYFCLD